MPREQRHSGSQIIEHTCYHDTRLIISFDPNNPDHQGHEEHNTVSLHLTLIKTEYWDRAGGGGNISYDS